MSDGARSTAEKLAAAKKKHKAYLKEKNLKSNVTTIKSQQEEQLLPPVLNTVELDRENVNVETDFHMENSCMDENSKHVQSINPYEGSFPLPQYSTDYSDNHRSNLPDPLSFFDNFSNVSLQNFTQPLANFFNGSNASNLAEDVVELPNQILIEENHQIQKPTQHYDNQNLMGTIFSYDKFKSDALKCVNAENEIQSTETILDSHDMFEQFTNSASTDPETFHNSTICQTHAIEKLQDNAFLIDSKVDDKINDNKPVLFEIQPTLEVTPDISSENLPCHMNNENSGKTDELVTVNWKFPSNCQNKSEDLDKHELNILVEQLNMKCNQLTTQLEKSESKYLKLYNDFSRLTSEREGNETGNELKEDPQCYLQTINMLVNEKTELSSMLNEAHTLLKNESSQIEGLRIQLKEMKQQNKQLENELEMLRSEKLNSNSSQKEQMEIFNKIQTDYNSKQIQYEELQQDLLESKEKLKSSNEINSELQKRVHELSNQLSMANLKIQQLTIGETSQHENEIEKLNQEKIALEKQIHFLNESLKVTSKERDETNVQYQQYVAQLNSQIASLTTNIEQIQKENEQLKIREENRIKHIGELEKQLQNMKNDNISMDLRSNNKSLKKELESSMELVRNLQIEKNDMETNLTKILIDKELLEKELESCKFSISEMETIIEQLRGNQPDNAVLLATMESDKVAASRAISQNNELKKQMEGMQEVLVKVNNDNVHLTESISYERKTNRELLEKLQQTEIAYQTLAEAIEIKDKELVNLRGKLEQTSNHDLQHEQLSDRLRHYEAQEHSLPSLQKELQEAKYTIAHLLNELDLLKKNTLNDTNSTPQIQQENIQNLEETTKNEIDELRAQLNNLQMKNNELESLLKNTESKKIDTNGNESLDKDTAMKHLEKKFLKTMDEIAKLTEEKQRLEHLVLQLQGETETIGEYVTLYQQQRSILKQRALEKDQQLQQLTNDREIIKANLDRLNNLVSKLIIEKGAVTKELLDQHKQFSEKRTDLCEEHQKIHQEINRITGDSLKNSSISDNPNTEIAEEIISLLSEIKSSNLVQPTEGIHHCPWCSGKLITV